MTAPPSGLQDLTDIVTDDLDELRLQVLLGTRFLWGELHEVFGHVSCRLPGGDGFLVKSVRVGQPGVDPDEVLVCDGQGRKLAGVGPLPSELPIHTEILRRRPDVRSVVHTHPHASTAITTAGRTVMALTHQSARFGAGVPLFRGDLIATTELGQELADRLGDGDAVLLRGHGAVVIGRHVPEAVCKAIYLEQAALQLIWAASVGVPRTLPERLREHPFHTATPGSSEAVLWRQLRWEHERERGAAS